MIALMGTMPFTFGSRTGATGTVFATVGLDEAGDAFIVPLGSMEGSITVEESVRGPLEDRDVERVGCIPAMRH